MKHIFLVLKQSLIPIVAITLIVLVVALMRPYGQGTEMGVIPSASNAGQQATITPPLSIDGYPVIPTETGRSIFTQTPNSTRPQDLPAIDQYPPITQYASMRVMIGDRNAKGIFIQDVDGGNRVQVPPWSEVIEGVSGFAQGGIRPSPAGDAILFLFGETPMAVPPPVTQYSVWKTDKNGQDQKMLAGVTDEWYPCDGVWSPNGKRIAYVRNYAQEGPLSLFEGKLRTEIWTMDANGEDHKLVSAAQEMDLVCAAGYVTMFRWMNNGYIYLVNRTSDLYAVHPDTGDIYLLMNAVDEWEAAASILADGVRAVARSERFSVQNANNPFSVLDIDSNAMIAGGGAADVVLFMSSTNSTAQGFWIKDLRNSREKFIEMAEDGEPFSISPGGLFAAYRNKEGIHWVDIRFDSNNQEWLLADPGLEPENLNAITVLSWIPVP